MWGICLSTQPALDCDSGIRDEMLASTTGCEHMHLDAELGINIEILVGPSWNPVLDASGTIRSPNPNATARSSLSFPIFRSRLRFVPALFTLAPRASIASALSWCQNIPRRLPGARGASLELQQRTGSYVVDSRGQSVKEGRS